MFFKTTLSVIGVIYMKIKYIALIVVVIVVAFLAIGAIVYYLSPPTSPSSTPTSPSPTPTQERGSFSNPALVGEPVTAKGYGKTFEVTVLDFIRGEQANLELKRANLFNPSPDEGYEYLLVKVRIAYVAGEGSFYVSSYSFKAIAEGVVYSPTFAVLPKDKPELNSVDLIPGGKIEGWIAYEVPQNKKVLIGFEYLFEPLCYISIEK